MHGTTFLLTRELLPAMGLGGIPISSDLPPKPTASSIQGQFVHILTLRPFFMHLTIIETPAKWMAIRMIILRHATTLTSVTVNKTLIPMQFIPTMSVRTTPSVDSPKAPSARLNNQTGELANGFDFPLRCRRGKIPLPRFVLVHVSTARRTFTIPLMVIRSCFTSLHVRLFADSI